MTLRQSKKKSRPGTDIWLFIWVFKCWDTYIPSVNKGLTDFYKKVHLLFKKRRASDCQKKIPFVQITHLKFTFLTPYDIKSYYQQPNNCKIVLILFDINNEDIVISKLLSQLKLLPSLIELKDNDAIVIITIIICLSL